MIVILSSLSVSRILLEARMVADVSRKIPLFDGLVTDIVIHCLGEFVRTGLLRHPELQMIGVNEQ